MRFSTTPVPPFSPNPPYLLYIPTQRSSAALAALFCLCSCTEKQHTTDPEPQKLPIGFRPMSQAVMVKSGTAFPETIQKFGVWGIAGNNLNIQYLWNTDSFIDVYRQTDGTYKPATDAYWFSYSTHDFLALASNPSTVALPSVSISHTTNPNQLNPSMSFSYDLSERYTAKDYAFDLLGAAARKTITTVTNPSQDLLFWHLFSQININVTFVDGNGTTINTGTVSQMRLLNVDKEANYIISFNNNNELAVSCQSNSNQQANLTFDAGTGLVNILPQDISDFKLFLDFTTNGAAIDEFEIDLTNAKAKSPYLYNNKYNWIITIGPKQNVSFKVEVVPWTSSAIQDAENNNEFEII